MQKRSGPARGQARGGKGGQGGQNRPPQNPPDPNRQVQGVEPCPYCKRPLNDPRTAAKHVEACRAGYLSGIAVRHVDDRRGGGNQRRQQQQPRNKRAGH